MLDKILNDNLFFIKNGSFLAWYCGHVYTFKTVTDDYGTIILVSFKKAYLF